VDKAVLVTDRTDSLRTQSAVVIVPMDSTLQLPGELAAVILDYLDLRPTFIHVSHVSRRWRALAHSHPTFWRNIVLKEPTDSRQALYSLAEAQLRSSTVAGVLVQVDIRHGWSFRQDSDHDDSDDSDEAGKIRRGISMGILIDFCSALVQHLPRISSLVVHAVQTVLTSFDDHRLFNTPAPLLERLELSAQSGGSNDVELVFPWAYLALMPLLRVLRLQCIDANPTPGELVSPPLPHTSLEELLWRLPAHSGATSELDLEELLRQFPNLQTLELFPVPDSADNMDPVVNSRLTFFRCIALPGSLLQRMGVVPRLARVQRLQVTDPSMSTIQDILEHFLDSGSESSPPSLEIDLGSAGSDGFTNCQPLSFAELIPDGRRRDLDIVRYTWMPNVPAMESIAHRVTRLAVSILDGPEMLSALQNTPALQEFAVRLSHEDELLAIYPVIQCPQLVRVVLQSGQITYRSRQVERVEVSAASVADFVARVFHSSLHGKLELHLDLVVWSSPVETIHNSLGSYFKHIDT